MKGNEIHGSIVVYNNLVDIFNSINGFSDISDLVRHVPAGSLSEDRDYRITTMVIAQVQQPCRYQNADLAVNLRNMEMPSRYQTTYYGQGDRRLNMMVKTAGQNGVGVNPFSQKPDELAYQLFYQDRSK